MTEDEALEGAMVPAPKAADIRYEDETEPDAVTRVLVVVERADGSVKEYEAREPQQWQMNDPESISAQVIRTTGLSLASGGGFRGLQAGTPSLSLSFTANPRYNLHIRNKRKESEPAPGVSCKQPIWDGPYKMTCGRHLVDGKCLTHGDQSSIPSSSMSSPAATGKGS
jgi:hypothetical protein